MTVNTTTNRVSYAGNGTTAAFAVPFPFLANADLIVLERTDSTGAEVVKTLTTHYTVSGAGGASGTVTMLTAPATGVTLVIYRDPALTQLVDLVPNDPLPVETAIEQPLDRLSMIAQRNRELIERALRLPDGDTGFAAADMKLPAQVTRASKYLVFDADGKPTASTGTGTDAGLRADLASTADTALGDALIGGKRTAASAVTFTGHTYHEARALYLDLDFGAIGDGVADDTTAFINAATALRTAGGGRLVLGTNKTYKVLPTGGSTGAKLIDLQNCKGVVIEGQGSKVLTGNVTLVQSCIDLNATTDVLIRNLRFESGNAVLDATNGIEWIKAHQGAKRILLENLDFKYGRIGLTAVGAVNGGGSDTDRARDIIAINCDFDTTYYPLNFQGAGDNFFARGIRTRNAGRSYFPYNVRNHDVVLESEHGGPFSDVLLKVYSDTRWYSRLENIKLVYHSVGRTAGSGNQNADEAHVALDFQVFDAATAAPGAMENLDITIDISAQAAPNQSRSIFIVRKYDPAGAADATARGHLLTSTKVRGTGRGLPNLLGDWFRVCTRAGENWTGDVVNGIELGFSALDGNTTQVALAMNGQAFPGLNYHAGVWVNNFMGSNATLSRSNTTGKHVSITRSHFGNYHGGTARNSETYTPAWTAATTNPALGNGTLLGSYVLHGGLCTVNIQLTIGSTTTFGTGVWRFGLPVVAAPAAEMAPALGAALVFDSGTNWRTGITRVTAAGTYVDATVDSTATQVEASTPMVWAAGDILYLSITYPIGTF